MGTRFDDDPEAPTTALPAISEGANDTALDAILDSLVEPAELLQREDHLQDAEPRSPTSANDDKVLAAISDDPDLIRFYLSLCQTGSRKRSASPTDAPEPRRRRLENPADLLEEPGGSARRSKHVFAPTQPQRQVKGMLVSLQFTGKDAAIRDDVMISSRATKFQPHPAIIVRLYAFEFGARCLTIMHLRRFDFAARRAWYADSSVNLNNFAASIALPKASRPRSMEDVSNALTVLHAFTEEFFDDHTRRLISAAREFAEELNSFCQWTAHDVESLVFWFDRVLEDYRAATVSDARTGATSRTEVQSKLSLRDPELQSVLYVIQSERVSSFTTLPASRPMFDGPARADSGRRPEPQRSTRKTPREVIDALPRKGGLSVCMKYWSSRGCSSKSDERCTFPNHVHFLPDDLAPVVRNHIQRNMGDLRRELIQ